MLYVIYRFSKLIDILPGVVSVQTAGQVIGEHLLYLSWLASASFFEGEAPDYASAFIILTRHRCIQYAMRL